VTDNLRLFVKFLGENVESGCASSTMAIVNFSRFLSLQLYNLIPRSLNCHLII
jgi:hypothetical protein